MKKILLALIFLCSNAFGFDSSTAFNVVTMSYTANTSLYQRVVLNESQKLQNIINFSVDVKNGGGRPTHDLNGVPQAYSSQTDSATVTIKVFDHSGGLIGSQTSSAYILKNWGSNPGGWSAVPGDNLHPWTTASIAYNGSLTYARWIEIWMTGTDGAWWAGNYGPQWRAPTVTIGSSTQNLAYNPEFGISPTNQQAQGWFNTGNTWSTCGGTSGNAVCVTAESGVTANMWGGGYSANGGTLSGQVGGYTSTLSTTTADTAASTGSPTPTTPTPMPAPIYNSGVTSGATTYITNHYPTSNNSPSGEGAANAFDNNPYTKYLNFDKTNAGVTVKLNSGRVVTGFTLTTANDFSGRDPTSYKLYGSNDGTNWTLIQEGALSLSDNRFTTSSEIPITNSSAYVYYYIFFPTTKAGEGCGLDCNSMQIAEITFYYDSNNTTTSTATGTTVSNPGSLCCGGSAAPFSSNSSFTSRVQTFINRTTADSQVYIEQIGNSNTITVQQTGTKNNYVDYFGNGSFNTVTINQSGNSSTTVNYIEANIGTAQSASNSNTVNLTQTSTGGGKGMMVNVTGSNNSLTVQQKDSGSHYAEITLGGGNKTVNILQQGSANHMANVGLYGTPTSLTLNQSGSTQQYYSITHTCATAGGCAAITVNQGQ